MDGHHDVTSGPKGLNHCQLKNFLKEVGPEYDDAFGYSAVIGMSRSAELSRLPHLQNETQISRRKKRVKQSRYRPVVVQRVPGS